MGSVFIHLHIHQKGSHLKLEDRASDSRLQHTPTPWDDIKVFGEVSSSHTISRPAEGKPLRSFLGIVVNGRVDHEIGRVLIPGSGSPSKRRFQSLLVVVEAKTACNLTEVIPELVVYLGAPHQSRQQRNRRDCTVYGVASDRFSFIFLIIWGTQSEQAFRSCLRTHVVNPRLPHTYWRHQT